MEEKKRKKKKKHIITQTGLKLYTYVTLFFYYLSTIVFQRGLLHIDQYDLTALREFLASDPGIMSMAGIAVFLQILGGLGIPVAAFLLAEGFVHTGDRKRYFLRMILFACISEIPYDLAMHGTVFELSEQNMLFTLAIALVMLYGLALFEGKPGFLPRIAQGAVLLASVLWGMLLRSEFGFFLLILTAVYYLMRAQKGIRILMGCALSVMYVSAPFSGYALWLYEGDRGREVNKYVFYILYPVLLLLLAGAVRFCL